MSSATLTRGQRASLQALCRAMLPHLAAGARPVQEVSAAVEERLERMDAELSARIAGVLSIIEHPLTGLAVSGRPQRFSARSAEDAASWLRAWETSRIGMRRTLFQALRRLILSTYYTMPEAHRAIGYLGPLHERPVAMDWEGPANGVSHPDAEPVARLADPSAWANADPTRSAEWPREHGAPPGLRQGHEHAGETAVRAEICVIGTGAGGAVVAARLAEAGHDVVMLEEGGYWTPADFDEREAEQTRRLYVGGGALSTDDLSISLLQGRSVGGGTTVNWMIMLRTPERVLEEWRRDHGLAELSSARMAELFDSVEEEVHSREVPDDAHSPNNRIILEGARRLGWSASAGRINARGCVRSGFCGMGCRYRAKRGALTTYVPRALAAGARLYSDARVESLEAGRTGTAKRVHATVLDRDTGAPRGSLVVDAEVVVLAAGAIGTPAILQRSGFGGGGVGRYLRLHPTTSVVGLYPRPIYAAAGIPLSAICDEFVDGENGYGTWIECPPMHPSMAAAAMPGFGELHRSRMMAFERMGSLIVLARDGADTGRSNGDVRVDRRGRPRIRYRLGESDRRNLVRGMTAAARLHLAAGAEEVFTLHCRDCTIRAESELRRIHEQSYRPNDLNLFSAHLNGTCRMGTDPRTSGCTPDGQRHGVPGLYVADGSLLPTAPGVNPQETVMALATHVAERVRGA